MAKVNIFFNGISYSVDESVLADATAALQSHLLTVMNGTGATINLGGNSYNVDSTKLTDATNTFISHLGTIAGGDEKVVIGGIEYGIDATEISGAITGLQATLDELESGGGDEPSGDLPVVGTSLEDCTWAQISAISAAGKGEEYFNIGDTKSIRISGTVGTLDIDTTLYVYIIGFNHNSELEGNGITFGTFKTADGADVALYDSNYIDTSTDGTKYFNMNHWGGYNYGGWSASDLRYDILGSTNIAPLNYGSARSASDVGYDATTTCAVNPVANTLMAALPAELRAVMKPMTVYTDNIGSGSGSVEDNISATIDYLPLLGEYEIFGTVGYANEYEKNKQAQYEYFAAGNSKVKYYPSSTSSALSWWGRSPYYDNHYRFCRVNYSGSTYNSGAWDSYGLAPVFKV